MSNGKSHLNKTSIRLVMNMSGKRRRSAKVKINCGVLERDMQVHLVLYVLICVVFTLMKIFLKVDCRL